MDDYEEAVLFTIAALESRLDRIEYVLSGRKKQAEEAPRTFSERMQRIERSLQQLSEKTQLLNQVQDLSMYVPPPRLHLTEQDGSIKAFGYTVQVARPRR
jgi:hypothetical protein